MRNGTAAVSKKKKLSLWEQFLEEENRDQLVKVLFFVYLGLGIFARIWRLGGVPGGLNQDEAFAGYEAYSILRTGRDTAGYAFPVYLTAWGSGMNALETYLMIPFVAIFGLEVWAIRIPQMIVGICALVAVYDILKRFFGRGGGLCGLFLVSIAPWHVFLSRWALESNLAPGFLLFGLCFFLRGIENPRWYLLSATFYGLSLYCYAVVWPFVPVILLLQLIYLWHQKKLSPCWEIFASIGILFILALPLMLFLLVNWDFIPAIELPFLSVPKIVRMRDSEFTFQKTSKLLKILLTQVDGLQGNATNRFGMFYYCTLPFCVVGLHRVIRESVREWRRESQGGCGFLLVQFIVGLLEALSVNPNINRVNMLWFPILLLSAVGIWHLGCLLGKKSLILPLVIYTAMFLQFECYYFTEYYDETERYFAVGLEQALNEAVAQDGPVYVCDRANYARILFYSQQDPDEYRQTVEYTNYPAAFLKVGSFGRFRFNPDYQEADSQGIYILDSEANARTLEAQGFIVENYETFYVAYRKN